MKKLIMLVLLLLAVGLFGEYRGWFAFSKDKDGDTSKVSVTVDKSKLHDDESKAANAVKDVATKVQDVATHK